MNKQENDILNTLFQKPFINQRILADASGHSLGVVNRSLKKLIKLGYLDDSIHTTQKLIQSINKNYTASNYSSRRLWNENGSNQH